MAYTALARTWRPKNFAELVGQEHVRRALVNALESGRVHHAFLFTGTRGVGKTTIARIFAKCLNCETGVTANPCGVCGACREIDSGRFIDLIEVDAASRTKVDDTREMLDNVQYSPTRGRYKVYLIDEVHMLSTHSFNALLKTFEEPPPHVKFLLATTDPQKLPVTVLSRCLQFNLKRLPVAQITERMREILEKEGVEFEAAGLRLVAQAADGSMRDGLSLLDQLIAFGGGKAGEEEARAMLGTIARDHVVRLAELLGVMNVPELLSCAHSLEEFAPDYAQVLDELASLFVRIAMKQAVNDFEGDELYAPEVLDRLAKAIAPEDVQLFYQTAITGRRDLGLAPDPRTGFEMTLLRMIAFRPLGEAEQVRGTLPAAGVSAAGGGGAAARAAAGGGVGGARGAAGGAAAGGARSAAGGAANTAGGVAGAAGGTAGAAGAAGAAGVAAGTTGAAGGMGGAAAGTAGPAASGSPAMSGAAAARAAAAGNASRGGAGAAGGSPQGGAPGASASRGSAPGASGDASRGSAPGASGDASRGGTSGASGDASRGGTSGASGDASRGGTPGASGGAPRGGAPGASGGPARGGAAALGSGPAGGFSATGDRTTGAADDVARGRASTAPAVGASGDGPGLDVSRRSADVSAAGGDSAPASAPQGGRGAGGPAGAGNAPAEGAAAGSTISEPWAAIVGRLELGGAARQLASNCLLIGRQGAVVRLALDARNKHMRTPAQEDKLTQALSRYFGQLVRLEFEAAATGAETPAQAEQRASMEDLDAARRAFESDPGVQGLRERFGATLLPDTVRPVK
jgi:DNA polymerase-3 subunit gamma/tau